jgi:YidC/Oxa1 family membrane protein insertase
MTSTHLTLRENALGYYDTVFCNGPNYITELEQTEKYYGFPSKHKIKTGFPLLDELLQNVESLELHNRTPNEPPVALVAPSWQVDNITELCLEEVVRPLADKGFKVVFRPHPEQVKRFRQQLDNAIEPLKDIPSNRFVLETDFSSNETVYTSDIVITDWSSVAQEYSYATKKPCIFVNTPIKVTNPNYKAIDAIPLEIGMRTMIGVELDIDKLCTIGDVACELIKDRNQWKNRISEIMNENIYNIGNAAKAQGEFILSELKGFESLR